MLEKTQFKCKVFVIKISLKLLNFSVILYQNIGSFKMI